MSRLSVPTSLLLCAMVVGGLRPWTHILGGNPQFRFKKLNNSLELPAISYPIERSTCDTLIGTAAVSPRWFSHAQVLRATDDRDFDQLNRDIWSNIPAFEPTHPDDDKMEKVRRFWSEFREVVAAQQMRRAGVQTKTVMSVHPLFEAGETMDTSAQRVRADFPTHFPLLQIERFLSSGLELDPKIFQRSECGGAIPEFVNKQVALSALAGWSVAEVSPAAFGSKWYVGRLRPEETAMMISMMEGIPVADDDIKEAIANMSLTQAADFTAYDEGSPVHPSWPAMHSAASSLSMWLDMVALLTDEQREEVRLLDYSISYFRTFAGVHYPTDNRAGLALGQNIVKNKLPDHLADMYACDEESKVAIKDAVLEKMADLESNHPLDWSTWSPNKWNPPKFVV